MWTPEYARKAAEIQMEISAAIIDWPVNLD